MTIDSRLVALADPVRRAILERLRSAPGGELSVDRLLTELQSETQASRPRLEATLHHVHLPKLDDAGMVEQNDRRETVHYTVDERTERVLDAVTSLDDPPDHDPPAI